MVAINALNDGAAMDNRSVAIAITTNISTKVTPPLPACLRIPHSCLECQFATSGSKKLDQNLPLWSDEIAPFEQRLVKSLPRAFR
jgi:hypothetical protein